VRTHTDACACASSRAGSGDREREKGRIKRRVRRRGWGGLEAEGRRAEQRERSDGGFGNALTRLKQKNLFSLEHARARARARVRASEGRSAVGRVGVRGPGPVAPLTAGGWWRHELSSRVLTRGLERERSRRVAPGRREFLGARSG
jgi:hypothetical protein